MLQQLRAEIKQQDTLDTLDTTVSNKGRSNTVNQIINQMVNHLVSCWHAAGNPNPRLN